jgi:hypothetical protein
LDKAWLGWLKSSTISTNIIDLLLFLEYYLLDTITLRTPARSKHFDPRVKLVHPAKAANKGPIKATVARQLLVILRVTLGYSLISPGRSLPAEVS